MVKNGLRLIDSPSTMVRALTLALSLLASGCALVVLLGGIGASSMALRYRPDALVLLSAFACLSLILFFTRRATVVVALLLVRLALAVVIGIPLGSWMPVKLALWSSLVIETCGYFTHPACLPAAGGMIVSVLLSQRPFQVWGVMIAPPPLLHLSAAGAWLFALAACACCMQALVSALAEEHRTVTRLDEAVRQITAASLGFQHVASTMQERSAEDERKRITRDIHDSIGYALTNLIMMLEAAIRLAPGNAERLRRLLAQAREEAQLGLNETRRVLRVMRAVGPDVTDGLSLIHRLVTVFRQATGIEVQVEYCNAARSFGAEADTVVYHMVQEGLTNAFRHGRATLIRLTFWQEANAVRVNLWDNGMGGEDITEGIGLSGMRERIERIGGMLRFGRTIDGFELSAWLPVENVEGNAKDNIGVG